EHTGSREESPHPPPWCRRRILDVSNTTTRGREQDACLGRGGGGRTAASSGPYFLNRSRNACRWLFSLTAGAGVGGAAPPPCFSTSTFGSKSPQRLLALLFGIRISTPLMHSLRAAGSKWRQLRHVCRSVPQLRHLSVAWICSTTWISAAQLLQRVIRWKR